MIINQCTKIFVVRLSVRPSVCGGCGSGRNEFAGRVQNHHVRFSFHKNSHVIFFLEMIVEAAAGTRSGHSVLQVT